MFVKDCMTKKVEIADPEMSLREAAQKMHQGDFGFMPVGEKDRLVGMVTDRDITVRAVAQGKDAAKTKVREIMSDQVLYCFEDQTTEEVAENMGLNQVRRLPVLNRQKRLVGILSLGDLADPKRDAEHAKDALCGISRHEHHEPGGRLFAS
jgi:CBS domain-containing protein